MEGNVSSSTSSSTNPPLQCHPRRRRLFFFFFFKRDPVTAYGRNHPATNMKIVLVIWHQLHLLVIFHNTQTHCTLAIIIIFFFLVSFVYENRESGYDVGVEASVVMFMVMYGEVE
ncbi:hypothetical protein PIB30_079934 [Stylosanthes scabra]|uniref:Transmembrane protein n=1 Tax=Stylosanthes scabra TaxID=79078 RepID=A0ABU6XPP3_9FABA|nr:hypothetical protein [Stylosanthes scabra]